jgi:hypothetical protein
MTTFKLPFVEVMTGGVLNVCYDKKEKMRYLSLYHMPISFTFGVYNNKQVEN